MRFYCTSTGPIGGLNCEVLLYFNWSHRWSPVGPVEVQNRVQPNGLNCEVSQYSLSDNIKHFYWYY